MTSMAQHRILIVHDVDGWAFHRRAQALQAHSPADFSITTLPVAQAWRANASYDLAFVMSKYLLGDLIQNRSLPSCPIVVGYNSGLPIGREDFPSAAIWMIANNKTAWVAAGRPERSCCVANGVDRSLWSPEGSPIAARDHVALWCSSRAKAGWKGLALVAQLRARLKSEGFEFDVQIVNSTATQEAKHTIGAWPSPSSTEDQAARYRRASYVLCASDYEGTPNVSLEGMASGCVLVTTRAGNAMEFGSDRENLVFSDRSVSDLATALRYARDHRARLSAAGLVTMARWGWRERSGYYFALFRRLISGSQPAPFAYDEITPEEIS